MTSVLVFFWLGLAIAFAAMSVSTYETRRRMRGLMRALTYEWLDEHSPFHVDHKPSVTNLESIFDHMLTLELLAFVLTAISAFVEYASTLQVSK